MSTVRDSYGFAAGWAGIRDLGFAYAQEAFKDDAYIQSIEPMTLQDLFRYYDLSILPELQQKQRELCEYLKQGRVH